MLLITARSSRVIEDSDNLRSKLYTLCNHSQLHIFCNIVRNRYLRLQSDDVLHLSCSLDLKTRVLIVREKYYSHSRQSLSSLFLILIPSSLQCGNMVI